MNRGEFKTALTARLGIPPTGDGLITSAALVECLDLALTDLSYAKQWPWLLTSASLTFTAGVAPFPTSPAVADVRELSIDGRRAKKAGSLPEFLDALGEGNRCVWFVEGTNVKLAPVPTIAPTTATLYYSRAEPALAADAQSPLVPPVHHNVVLARAAYHANVRRTRWETAAQDNGEYEAGLKRMGDAARSIGGQRSVRHVGVSRWAVWG